jgi:hypothetical protein
MTTRPFRAPYASSVNVRGRTFGRGYLTILMRTVALSVPSENVSSQFPSSFFAIMLIEAMCVCCEGRPVPLLTSEELLNGPNLTSFSHVFCVIASAFKPWDVPLTVTLGPWISRVTDLEGVMVIAARAVDPAANEAARVSAPMRKKRTDIGKITSVN